MQSHADSTPLLLTFPSVRQLPLHGRNLFPGASDCFEALLLQPGRCLAAALLIWSSAFCMKVTKAHVPMCLFRCQSLTSCLQAAGGP